MRQNELFPPNCFLFENLFEGRVLLVETPRSRDLRGGRRHPSLHARGGSRFRNNRISAIQGTVNSTHAF